MRIPEVASVSIDHLHVHVSSCAFARIDERFHSHFDRTPVKPQASRPPPRLIGITAAAEEARGLLLVELRPPGPRPEPLSGVRGCRWLEEGVIRPPVVFADGVRLLSFGLWQGGVRAAKEVILQGRTTSTHG